MHIALVFSTQIILLLGLIYTVLPPCNLEWTILAFLKGQTAPALPTNYFKNIH